MKTDEYSEIYESLCAAGYELELCGGNAKTENLTQVLSKVMSALREMCKFQEELLEKINRPVPASDAESAEKLLADALRYGG